MVTFSNQSYVLGLFNTANTDSHGIVSIDLSSLITSQSSASAAAATAKAAGPPVPTAPWSAQETPAQASANVTSALAGQSIVNTGATLSSTCRARRRTTTSFSPSIRDSRHSKMSPPRRPPPRIPSS